MATPSLMTIGAHADDNEFCFGGTMYKCREKLGYDIVYVQSSNNMSGAWTEVVRGPRSGLSPLPAWIDRKRTTVKSEGRLVHTVPWYHEMHQRKTEAEHAARACFHTEPIHLDYAQRHYTDSRLNRVDLRYGAAVPECYDPSGPTIVTAHEFPEPVERVKALILEKNPEVILTHAPVDANFEHSATAHLVRKAFDRARSEGYDGSLLCSVSSHHGLGGFFERWDAFVDTGGFYEKKREAISMHACQFPYPDQLDLWDPTVGQICGGLESAEPFTVVSLSGTRGGALTEELAAAHDYCIENWARLFFSPESRERMERFLEHYRRRNTASR